MINTDTLHRIEAPTGEFILAWGCPCGEEADGQMAMVKWDEEVLGIKHSWCHVECLKKEADA